MDLIGILQQDLQLFYTERLLTFFVQGCQIAANELVLGVAEALGGEIVDRQNLSFLGNGEEHGRVFVVQGAVALLACAQRILGTKALQVGGKLFGNRTQALDLARVEVARLVTTEQYNTRIAAILGER
jgi:hypothetical protein